MPFTVLKISRKDARQIEVLGEFSDEETAQEFANVKKQDDETNLNEYLVESPEPKYDFGSGRGVRPTSDERLPDYLNGYLVGRRGFEQVFTDR